MNVTRHLLKGSDNEVAVLLTQDDVPLIVSWTELSVFIGRKPYLVTITRAAPGSNGVDLASGILTIRPSDLTEDLSALKNGQLYPVIVEVKDGTSTLGNHFAAADSENRLFFHITEP